MLEDDYFNENGVYLGSDEAETDYVRVIDQMTWDTHKNDGIIESIKHETGEQLSVFHSEAGISEEASLEIYDHYNPMDLELKAHDNEDGKAGMSFSASDPDNITVKVKMEGNKNFGIADHYYEIENTFAHEEKHYNDYNRLGRKGFAETSVAKIEFDAYNTQMDHSSYLKTRSVFQTSTQKYRMTWRDILFPQ